ncbi:MAG: PilZ domain-containing protein [Pyrinomonadaceae bacterium]
MPRQYERVTYFTETLLECASGRHPARMSDLSLGGCYIDSIAEVRAGEVIKFWLSGRDGSDLTITARVAYVHPGIGFGVTFLDLSENSRQFVQDAIERARGS